MILGTVLVLMGVVITAVSQTLLKISARRKHKAALNEYLNPYVVVAYGLFFCATLCTVTALRYISLAMSTAVGALVQIAVPLASWLFLKEKISKRRWIGILLITIGVAIFCI